MTVWELVQKLTADHIDPTQEVTFAVNVFGSGYYEAGDVVEVTSRAGRVDIEVSDV